MTVPRTPRSESPLDLEAPVVAVTLFEDRARVLRRGDAEIPVGRSIVRVAGVAPALTDATLVVTTEPEPEARVVDSRVARRLVVPDRDAVAADLREELRRELEELDHELGRLSAREAQLKGRDASLLSLQDLLIDEIADDVAWGRRDAGNWEQGLEQLHQERDRLIAPTVDLGLQLWRQRQKRQRLAERLAALDDPSRQASAAIECEVEARAAASYTVEIEYVVPGACWRPYHTARLLAGRTHAGETSRVELCTDACVWQNTGEDWHEVALAFSTRRPSLGTEPPRLQSDVLRVQPKQENVVVETRDQKISTTGLSEETTTPESLPGIDDGGETVNLQAQRPTSVVSDGRPLRVPLSRFVAECETACTARPEVAAAVVLETRQENRSAQPILAGPVDLVRDGGFGGRTSLLFIAPGERFRLVWGPEPDLRIDRQTESVEQKQRALSSWQIHEHRVLLQLSNLGESPRVVELIERVPVSEIDKVVVALSEKDTTGGAQPNENGFLTWTVELPSHSTESVALKYAVRKHQDVEGL